MSSWFLIRIPRPFNGERIVSSANGDGTAGFPHGKKKMKLDHIQKLIQNGSAT